ncbi:2-(1,2-epoxy-1,2-dihydrophenyl)acetyl-CoA isomerase [Novosphingobium umbonatum]|uniref:2-(1,2-epoxy-1,2-dihydrophenyl)acetyl-CoA isomerase n=1 Tax=Novosphingobium umbonatum TaxID=1908524 RepID=A0A3S2Y9W3_9SPHN|nr:enoyl-CoA hydratase-related protein [Novosphingobium umbonatum]RVU05753.1 2-(1,2-epoxy-1,2-dihydrophenyl)acetyl-CoA isomerase [Novosphingobium umbonatum]
MADYRFIAAQREGDVVTIALNRPEKLNALTPAVFAELGAAVRASVEAGARALVLTGEGRFFCSGADIQPDGAGYDGLPEDLGQLLDQHYHPFVRQLAALEIPVVTALNGPCAGAGVSLALAGDIVVMGEGGYLLLAFVNIGLVPDAGATWLVARSVGRARALDMALTGERLGATEARSAGLVTRVVPDGEVLGQAQALAAKLASGPTRAMASIRQTVASALTLDFDATLEVEREHQTACGRTQDFAEAIAAFAQKRKPQFKGC